MMKYSITFAAAIVAAVAVAGQAAVVTWETPTQISTVGDTIVETDGAKVIAENVGQNNNNLNPPVTATVTVNTVQFDGVLTWGDMSNTHGLAPGDGVYDDGGIGASFNTMMQSAAFTNPTGTRTLTGLGVGNEYLIQIFTSDARDAGANRWAAAESGGSTTSPRTFRHDGYSYVGTFIADATTQDVLMHGYTASSGGSPDTAVVLNGFQLRLINEVPVPAALPAGLALICLFVARRRR